LRLHGQNLGVIPFPLIHSYNLSYQFNICPLLPTISVLPNLQPETLNSINTSHHQFNDLFGADFDLY
jgi:hypothetical protein